MRKVHFPTKLSASGSNGLSFSLEKLIVLLSPSEPNCTCEDLAAVPASAQPARHGLSLATGSIKLQHRLPGSSTLATRSQDEATEAQRCCFGYCDGVRMW